MLPDDSAPPPITHPTAPHARAESDARCDRRAALRARLRGAVVAVRHDVEAAARGRVADQPEAVVRAFGLRGVNVHDDAS